MKKFLNAFVKILFVYAIWGIIVEVAYRVFKLLAKGIKKIWYRTGHAVKCSEEEVKNL